MSVGTHFDMAAFADALEEERARRGVTWAEMTREVHRGRDSFAAMSASSFSSMGSKTTGNSAIVLQALLWLGRTPESFVVGRTRPQSKAERLVQPPLGQTLRFDSALIYPALDAERTARGMTWFDVGRGLPRYNEATFRRLAAGQQIGWPHGMGLFLWLDKPAASFTRPYVNPPAQVSLNKAAKELRISVDELSTRIQSAGITPTKFGGQFLIRRDELDSLTT
jgi:hypothetical protein